MKKCSLQILLALLVLSGNNAFAQTEKKTDKWKIANVVKGSFDEIWSPLDAKKIEKFYTKDFLLLENGEIWNNDSIAHYLNKAAQQKPKRTRVNTMEVIEIKITGKTAWIAYKNAATFYVDNKIVRTANWLESATLLLSRGTWKLDMLHSTRTKNETALNVAGKQN